MNISIIEENLCFDFNSFEGAATVCDVVSLKKGIFISTSVPMPSMEGSPVKDEFRIENEDNEYDKSHSGFLSKVFSKRGGEPQEENDF